MKLPTSTETILPNQIKPVNLTPEFMTCGLYHDSMESCMVKLPLFSERPDFKSILGKMGLQARGCGGVDSDSVGGIWDISNADRNVQLFV